MNASNLTVTVSVNYWRPLWRPWRLVRSFRKHFRMHDQPLLIRLAYVWIMASVRVGR
jgi:hypothetical protein